MPRCGLSDLFDPRRRRRERRDLTQRRRTKRGQREMGNERHSKTGALPTLFSLSLFLDLDLRKNTQNK